MATTEAKQAAPKAQFTFKLDTGITIPEDINEGPARPNLIKDEFLTPALTMVMADEKQEPSMFFPLSYFQATSDDWATKNGKPKKELKIGDARQKLNDAFKKFQEKNAKAAVVEMLLANRTGKEGDAAATEPGVRVWMRLKKK